MIVHLIDASISRTKPKRNGVPSGYCETDGASGASGRFEPAWWWVNEGCPDTHQIERVDYCEDCLTSATLGQDILGGMFDKRIGQSFSRNYKKLTRGTNR